MFTLMFTSLFGGALARSTGEYLEFLLPGILAQTVVFITMYTGVTLNTDLQNAVFDRFRSLPVWRPAALVGMLLGDAVRYSIASAMVLVLGSVLARVPAPRGRGGGAARRRAGDRVRVQPRVGVDRTRGCGHRAP